MHRSRRAVTVGILVALASAVAFVGAAAAEDAGHHHRPVGGFGDLLSFDDTDAQQGQSDYRVEKQYAHGGRRLDGSGRHFNGHRWTR